MKIIITESQFKMLVENIYVDRALDEINKLGGFNKLSEIDKLALLGSSKDEEKLKKIDLNRLFGENGGTFGMLEIKVKIKDINDQSIEHKFSKEFAGKEGWLFPYIHYTDDYDEYPNNPYVIVRFKDFISGPELKGGGYYEQIPIFLGNLYPIDYSEIDSEFVEYKNKIDFEQKEFRKEWDELLGDDDL